MKLSKLLATRQRLLRQTQLANLAYAYTTLRRFAVRIGNANLSGLVKLRPADPEDESYWATLTALEGSQSVIEEHFGDQELIELADAMTFATEADFSELDFRLEELGEKFIEPLRQTLESAGVTLDAEPIDLTADSSEELK